MSSQTDQAVQNHYGAADLTTTILNAIAASGKNIDQLKPEDLWTFDQLHSGGVQATRELAARAQFKPGETVLDIGGGLGGSARVLASEFGCDVTVLDLTPQFIRAGEELTRRVHLDDRVHFRQGNALDLPFEPAAFDAVWTQHSSMNMPNKPQLYRGIFRVLKPGGRLAMHEIMAGPNQPLTFPLPWASTPDISFVLTPEEMRDILRQAGFVEQEWVDQTQGVIEFFRQRTPTGTGEPSPLGLGTVMPDEFAVAFRNVGMNMTQDRLRVIQAVLVKPR